MDMARPKWRVSFNWWLVLCFACCLINGGVFIVLRHRSRQATFSDNVPVSGPQTLSGILKAADKPTTKTPATTTTTTTTASTTSTTKTSSLTTSTTKPISSGRRLLLPTPCQRVPQPLPPGAQFLPCDWRNPKRSACPHRFRAVLRCSNSSASIAEERVKVGTPPVAVAFDDACLARAARERCSRTGQPVPNIVHYIHFSPSGKAGTQLPAHTFLSLASAVRFLQPCLLLFHADYLPFGKHWEALLQLTSRVVHVQRKAPGVVFGRAINKIEHKSDVARLEAMKSFGGIYMDTDEVVLRPMNDLMQHHVTMAWERPGVAFGNGLILAEPGNAFVKAWHEAYRKFTNKWWSYFSTVVPRLLYNQHPEMNVHVVDTFFRPNMWNITEQFYKGRYDWSNHYALHLYYRRNQKYFEGDFERQNSSLGEISRHILFGDKTKCL